MIWKYFENSIQFNANQYFRCLFSQQVVEIDFLSNLAQRNTLLMAFRLQACWQWFQPVIKRNPIIIPSMHCRFWKCFLLYHLESATILCKSTTPTEEVGTIWCFMYNLLSWLNYTLIPNTSFLKDLTSPPLNFSHALNRNVNSIATQYEIY